MTEPATSELAGLRFPMLPEEHQPLDGILLVKCLRSDGKLAWVIRVTEDLSPFEALGVLEIVATIHGSNLVETFQEDPS